MGRLRRETTLNVMAVWLPTRVALRQSWRSSLALAILFGAAAGLAASSLSTADRIESAYDDLLRDVHAPQLLSACFDCGSLEDVAAFLERLRTDPAVADVVAVSLVEPVLRTGSGELLGRSSIECADSDTFSLIAAEWPRSGGPPVRLVDGRLANNAHEIALPLVTAQRAGLAVGDEVVFEQECFGYTELAAPIRLQVVGLFVGFLDVRPPGQETSFEFPLVTTDFAAAAGIEIAPGGAAVWLNSDRSVADLEPANTQSIFLDLAKHANDIRSRLQPDATALRLFAALMTIAAAAVLGQLLARHIRSAAANHVHLRSLGARPINLAALGITHGAAVGIATGLVTLVATVGLAPLVPLGVADYAARGTATPMPWTAAVIAAVISGGAVTLLSVVPAAISARNRRRSTRSQPSLVNRFAGRTHLPVEPALGVRIAFDSSKSAHSAPVRSGLGAIVLAVAVVAGVVTFAGSLDHLRATPRLVGWNWDFVIDNDQSPPPPGIDEFLAAHPDVAKWSWGNTGTGLGVGEGEELNFLSFLSFSTGSRAVKPAIIAGRAPEGSDEVLLSPDVVELLDTRIGDTVDVAVEDWLSYLAQRLEVPRDGSLDRVLQFELVGTGVLYVSSEPGGAAFTVGGVERLYAAPTREEIVAILVAADFDLLVEVLDQEFGLGPFAAQLRNGGAAKVAESLAQLTDEQFASLSPSPNFNRLYIDLVDGAAPTELLAALNSFGMGVDGFGVQGIVDGRLATTTEVVPLDLRDVDWLPTGLGLVMAVTAAAVVAHLIATGAKSRRRDLATMRALGLKGSQARRAILWQGVALAIVAAIVAVPIGVIAGRFAWRRYVAGVGVIPEAVTPWLGIGVLVVTLALVAVLAAIWPALRAGRDRPLGSLHAE